MPTMSCQICDKTSNITNEKFDSKLVYNEKCAIKQRVIIFKMIEFLKKILILLRKGSFLLLSVILIAFIFLKW